MLQRSILLRNFLSYGSAGMEIPLGALNVIIGPNGAGKSNLVEAIGLLQSAPSRLDASIREGGGVRDWLWKGAEGVPTATLEALVATHPADSGKMSLRYRLDFTESRSRFEITDERIENAEAYPGYDEPVFYYRYENSRPVLNVRYPDEKRQPRMLRRKDVDPSRSILAQRQDPDIYPEITRLAETFGGIRIYRDWSLGRFTPPRLPQLADLPNNWLEENGRNLGLGKPRKGNVHVFKREKISDTRMEGEHSLKELLSFVGLCRSTYFYRHGRMTAVDTLSEGERPVVHSDRGAHYRRPDWLSRMEAAGLPRSMSDERFFGRLKNEEFPLCHNRCLWVRRVLWSTGGAWGWRCKVQKSSAFSFGRFQVAKNTSFKVLRLI